MERLCNFYIRHAGLFGAFFCAVPSVGWFIAVTVSVPFREVYVLRLALCLTVGCLIAAYLNRYGLGLWITKHRSENGPSTVLDGTLIGAAIGIGTALLPSLTALIKTNHLEEAKSFILISYLAATVTGAIMGTLIATAGQKLVKRSASEEE